MYRYTTEDKARILVNKIMADKKIGLLMEELRKYDKTLFMHSTNVAFLAAHECYILRYSKHERYIYTTAALLHDIGKIKIDIVLLNKEQPLTKEDYEIIKRHPMYGAEILKEAGINREIVEIVLHHHEKTDGSGYPNGLRGDEIPLGSKLISTIDAYDAMTSVRPYGTKKSKTQAIATIMYENSYEGEHVENLYYIDS